jgi:hypothetical protein
MKSRFAFVCLFAALAFPALGEGLDDLAWMAGSWMERKDRVETEEHWLSHKGGVLMGMNRTVTPGKRTDFEWMRIELRDGKPAFLASPGGRAPVEFKSIDQAATRIVFENAAHDFPQRVLYWRDGEALMARIEGTIQGQSRSRQWRFERIK